MRLTEKVHQILSDQIKPGDYAIDATAGNGHDTLFLAKAVGPTGKVLAIDLQTSAIEATRQRLDTATDPLGTVEICKGDHAEVLESRSEAEARSASAIVFNLGYLPGSDKCIQTLPSSTERALSASAQLVKSGGHLCVTAYRAHPGATKEADAVARWMQARAKEGWAVEYHEPPSPNKPPILWLARKA